MNRPWPRLLVMATVLMLLAACSGGSTPTTAPAGSRAPVASTTTSAAPSTVASVAAPSATAAGPASEQPSEEASAAAPSEEASGEPEPSSDVTPEPSHEIPSVPPGGLRWYCCLGTGQDQAQVEFENSVAADFSAAHPDTPLVFEVVTYDAAYDQLATQIQAQNPPDFAGPVGVSGIETFHGQWTDLTPLITSAGFDLSVYDQKLVDFYKTDEGQVGIPFDVYPSMLWYSRSLFDEADLEYPPHKFGEKYKMPDGTEVDWNYDTIRELGKLLTVDQNGNDATSPDFDLENVEQWGFDPQRDDLRYLGTYWAPGSLVGADGKTVSIPEEWKNAWKYFYNGMWTDHFIASGPIFDEIAEPAGGYAFFSGHVAMATNYLWTTYGLGEDSGVQGDWDIAVLPANNGQYVSPLNADTFAILKGSRNPDAAFEAVSYLVKDRAAELLAPDVYGGMPAKTDEQQPYLQSLDSEFSHDVDWDVVSESLQYPDIPNSESFMPDYGESVSIMGKYLSKWTTTPGLDLDAEIEALRAELQAAWDRAG
jgi:multiple sugar transport system substrate-binding protein